MTRPIHDNSDLDFTYSAHIEDYAIRILLPYQSGIYVDIGAYHPTEQSNTYALYRRGWHGLLFEPQPEYARQLVETRPRDITMPCALSDYTGQAELKLWWGASSIVADWPIPDVTEAGEPTGKITVPVRRLPDVLKGYPQIAAECDLCSIDVEGAEGAILSTIDFAVFRPQLFVVESAEWKTLKRRHLEWEHYLRDGGYIFIGGNFVNRFYVAQEQTDVLARADFFVGTT